jgi:predicted regulator of Ras-like GTPase activity (Roadblock/LC7/MglB family)
MSVEASSGFRVVDKDGNAVVKSNAAQTVKDENARLQAQVVGKTEEEAEKLLKAGNRTLFVGTRDGKVVERTSPKVFTNLTVEVKDGKVTKILGWY